MRGFETAFFGVCGTPPELKTSRAGKPYANFSVGVDIGEDRDGKAQTEWARVSVFGEVAERLTATLRKGDRLYCEGALTPSRWKGESGEVRLSLNVAAFKAEKVGVSALGRNKPKRTPHDAGQSPIHGSSHRPAAPDFRMESTPSPNDYDWTERGDPLTDIGWRSRP